MAKKFEVLDDAGNVLVAPPEPGSDLAGIIYLLEYGRARGFMIGPEVQLGAVTVKVRDLRQVAQIAREQRGDDPDIAPGSDMYVLRTGEE